MFDLTHAIQQREFDETQLGRLNDRVWCACVALLIEAVLIGHCCWGGPEEHIQSMHVL